MPIAVTGSIADRPPDALPRPVRRAAPRRPAAQGVAVVPGRRPGRPPRRDRRQHRVRHGPARAARRCWSARSGRLRRLPVLAGAARRRLRLGARQRAAHTARFVCTTDDDMCQIASFYAGRDGRGPQHRAGPGRRAGRRARPGADQRRRPGRRCCGTPRSAGSAATRSPPTRPSSWPGWAARTSGADRRRDVPVHQRLREGAAGAEDRLERRRGARPGRHPGHHARHGRDPDRVARARPPLQVPVVPAARDRRPDRRRRRVPGRLPRRASWGLAWSGPRRSARCWPRWCWRPSAPRSTQVVPAEFAERLAEVYGGTRPPRSPRTCPAERRPRPPDRRARRRRGRLRARPGRPVAGISGVIRPLDEDAVPDHEHQQRPDLAAVVVRAGPVLVQQPQHRRPVDQVLGAAGVDDVAGPVVHLVLEPVPDRHREAELAPVQHVRRDDLGQRPAQRAPWSAPG